MTLFMCVKLLATLTLVSAFLVSLASSEYTEIIVAEIGTLGSDVEEFGTCSQGQFECRNRECIREELLCDGIADCLDQSDETRAECTRPERICPNSKFRCDYGACVNKNAICNGVKDCLDNSDELLPECPRASSVNLRLYNDERNSRISSTYRRIYRIRVPKLQTTSALPPRELRPLPLLTPLTALGPLQDSASVGSSTTIYSFCVVPPQPFNGRWKLHRRFCKNNKNCDIPQGVALQLGSQLIYACEVGFLIKGNADVYCEGGGNWSGIPICIATTCSSLNSVSRAATCSRFGDRVSCRSSILPYTRAKVTCRINYGLSVRFSRTIEQNVECRPNGSWEPEPITCRPVCGVVNNPSQRKSVINGIPTETGAFPWHANLWRKVNTQRGPELEFGCSATIVHANIIVTAAHCVIDERTKAVGNRRHFRVTAGRNVNDDSGAAQNSPSIVYKVKNVYRYCEYFGLVNGYAADIALVELREPFQFSPAVLPACLDITSFSEQALRPGTKGKIDGFGRRSVSTPSPILQTVEVTYVPNSECKISHNPVQRSAAISNDEFCGAYSNETSVCDWDNGGGFVAKKGGLWHLMGVFVMDLGLALEGTQKVCGLNPYSLYTKVSPYMSWIQDVIFQLERYKSYPRCSFDIETPSPTSTTTTTTPRTTTPGITSTETSPTAATPTSSTTSIPTTTPSFIDGRGSFSVSESSCLSPAQPANGQWKLHQDLCNDTNCDIPAGVLLGPGSELTYSCAPGFRIKGNSNVFCGTKGRLSAIPECIEIRCSSLESVSTMVTCYRSNNWAPCNSTSLPKTRAVISCRVGYREEASSLKTGHKTVECNQDGEWELKPITCVPVCGVTSTRVTPTIVNGTAADITEFPWHATLYKQINATQDPKEFICGATIIQNNLLLTAAHCVYDDRYKAVEIPEKFYAAAGNRFRDYDSPIHDPRVVQKSTVKNIYVPCEYYGLEGNYASDIALIELQEPFQLSEILLPACLDVLGNSEQVLEPGAVGEFAGFGRTATGMSSALLLATKVPYVGFSQCKMSQTGDGNVALIVKDKFCGGSREGGAAVCTGDSGGGLTFNNGGVSNVMGILSVNLGVDTSMGEKTCDGKSYSLYTKVSSHMPWIRNVMSHLERDKTYPSCGSH